MSHMDAIRELEKYFNSPFLWISKKSIKKVQI